MSLSQVLNLVRHQAEQTPPNPPVEPLDEHRIKIILLNTALMVRRAADADPLLLEKIANETFACHCRDILDEHCGKCSEHHPGLCDGEGPCAA